ncbi:UNVERIFIED_CONTAM: hypothetical protein Sradi_4188700 [Sesamum radiatum]|uniref:SWIM-type domain-containing protein n=1 Tax=Sesamum radiatum TaxID=300843 RepID=A0AAW2P5H6_SESRA
MEIIESIDNLPVQDPPGEDFSAADLEWVKLGSEDRYDDVALIPYDRVDAFIIGECSNVECPTRFHIERGRKRAKGSLKQYKNDEYLEYRLYWCSFGPENYGEGGGILPSRRYRLNTRNRAARPQSMRGCTCHFVVKRLYARPSLALLLYNERRHVNKAGFVCHGPLDRDAIGPGAKKIPYVCSEKLGMIIKRSTHELDLDDQASIRLWVERNKKSIFFYRDTTETDPFILGIQTEWQLQQMIRFGHRNIIAADSTFGIKKLKYPLCTLLVFDSRQHALPVAWIITRSIAKPDVAKWMKALLDRVHSVDPGWKASGFLIDDAAAEIEPIRQSVLPREMFKRLGQIVYSIWGGVDLAVALEEFSLDFVDQTSFMQYFKDSWFCHAAEMWLTSMKTLPLASQEASGAIEAYHVKLKTKLYDDSHLGSLQRVDWLVHKLTTELHSSYWLDRYADESDSFVNVKEEYIASTSWHRALQIPDSAISLDARDHLFAKVVSQKDSRVTRVVWNPGSEFAHCDCEWSLQGNLCKHIIKVNMVYLWEKPMDDSVALDISTAWTHQMLDQVQKLVELNSSDDIGLVVNNMPLKWVAKKVKHIWQAIINRGFAL